MLGSEQACQSPDQASNANPDQVPDDRDRRQWDQQPQDELETHGEAPLREGLVLGKPDGLLLFLLMGMHGV